jgi:uncharacterized delta-60 repeat protein
MKILLRAGILVFLFFRLVSVTVAQNTCPGFGVNGMASSLESHTTQLNALTVLPNGKIVAVGYYDDSGIKDMLVARFNANGTPDLTFSYNGIRIYDVGDNTNDEALCVKVASDGNILVGGTSAGYGSIIKLDAAGKLVTSFGTGGKVKYDILYSSVEDLMVSPQGNIYGVGKSFHTENIVLRRLKVQAYTNNGVLLNAFSEDGKYDRTDFLLWHTTVVRGALQSDGKLVVGGTTPSASNILDNWFLVRLNTDGTSDNTFHADGLVEDPEFKTAHLEDLVIGSDGSIYVGGFSNLNSDFPTLAVAKKFKPNGDSDNSFNMSGSAIHTSAGNGAMMHAMAVDANGKVYIAGSKGTASDNHELLFAAFDANGEPAPDFTVVNKIANTTHGKLRDVVRLSDGSFVACGYAVGKDRSYGILRKYKADGTLESSFNAGGANFIRNATDGSTSVVAVQSDGKILTGGVYLENGSNTGIAIARFESNGTPDHTFGTYGYIRIDLTTRREFLYDLYVLPDGKILVGGTTNDATSGDDFLVIKLNASGSIDETFGTNGYVTKHIGAYGKHNGLRRVTMDSQGRILIAGDANYNGGSYQNATVMRLLPDGDTDTDFATNGVFSINLTVVNDFFEDIAVADDGYIYAAGYGLINVGGAVVKISDDGELVTDFATEGVFYTDWKEEYISTAHEIELQSDGKLLVGCSHKPKDGTNILNSFVYRLSTSGEPDNTFSENGRIEFSFASKRGIHGLKIDNTGLIYFSASDENTFNLAKINLSGNTVVEPFRIDDLASRSGIDINKATGNAYTGRIKSGIGGMWVVCVGGSGEPEPACSELEDPTITFFDGVLVSSDADSYQWYSDGEPLEGETNQSLTISTAVEGWYMVEVTIGECTLYSSDFEYFVTASREMENFRLYVYPNPAREYIVIESDVEFLNAAVSLHSIAGDRVQTDKIVSGTTSKINLENLAAGVYILSVQSGEGTMRVKVFKQN